MRSYTCADCNGRFDHEPNRGALPVRCANCKRLWTNANAQLLRIERDAPRTKVCKTPNCGTVFETPSRIGAGRGGSLARTCPECRRTAEKRRLRDWTEDTIRRHGWTVEQYEQRLAAQGGGCASCGRTDPGGQGNRFVMDHDHNCCPGSWSCGKCIRGLLCTQCNVGGGMFGEDPARLRAHAEYLETFAVIQSVSA